MPLLVFVSHVAPVSLTPGENKILITALLINIITVLFVIRTRQKNKNGNKKQATIFKTRKENIKALL